MAGDSKDYGNNATFSILHGMLDTEQLVEFVEIARALGKSPATVKNQLVSVYRNARAPAALGLPFDREQRT